MVTEEAAPPQKLASDIDLGREKPGQLGRSSILEQVAACSAWWRQGWKDLVSSQLVRYNGHLPVIPHLLPLEPALQWRAGTERSLRAEQIRADKVLCMLQDVPGNAILS